MSTADMMKRRTAIAVVSRVSSVLLLLAAASWMRSYFAYDQVSFGRFADGRWAWTAFSPSHPFTRWPPAAPKGASHTLLTCAGKIFGHESVYHGDGERLAAARGHGWASDDNVIPSFSYFYAATGDVSGTGWWTTRQVTMRHWALVALFALAPMVWFRTSRRKSEKETDGKK
jgi:hypothetical protein